MSGRRPLSEVLIGQSPVMQELRSSVVRYAPSALPVLILGPRGAGKELVAQALHDESGRSGAFVAFNACAIADSMFEDALFGHVRGAFTGATHDAAGYLTEAHRGTAFFDEITGISLPNQRKLLRVFETRVFRPVGARGDRTSDFRLLSATNDDLDDIVGGGRFRADLADRLGVLCLRVPPLRDRLTDVPSLAEHFLRIMDPAGAIQVSSAALRALASYPWPGNVRQLRHVLHRAALAAPSSIVNRADIEAALGAQVVGGDDREVSRADFERRRLIAVMESVEWSAERAAEVLAVHTSTVYRRLRHFHLTKQSARRVGRRGPELGPASAHASSDDSRAS